MMAVGEEAAPYIIYVRVVPTEPTPYPDLLRPQRLFPHPIRDRLLQRPRLPCQGHQEDRKVPPPPLRPPTIFGTR